MMAIVSGLNDMAIHRLSHTRAEVRPKFVKVFEVKIVSNGSGTR
jgi:hypothetical protein